jgi:hypothetical protein
MKDLRRNSVYLEKKVENLHTTLEYFNKGNERRIIFLSQIDFWDWEIAELIYSLTNFDERQISWQSAGLSKILYNSNFMLKFPIVESFIREMRWESKDYSHAVKAPKLEMNSLIERWNALLDRCEKELFLHKAENMKEAGGLVNAIPNLDKYRKDLLEVI